MSQLTDKAIVFAAKAHKGTFRKGLKQPYMFHPLEVMSLTSLITLDEDILCAAVLHDTVEDTQVSIDDIKREFGDRIAALVGSETEDKRGQVNKAGTWVERKQESIDELKGAKDIGIKIVALCDKVSNLRSFHLLQMQVGEEMWTYFNMRDPLKHYWYYKEIANALEELSEYPVYKEYLFLIDSIFNKYLER